MKQITLHHKTLGSVTVPESTARVLKKSGWSKSKPKPEPEPQTPSVEPTGLEGI